MTTTIKPGDLVRSYDFPDHDELETTCFVEGVVESVTDFIEGCKRYKIKVSRRVFSGVELDPTEWRDEAYITPPINGTPRLGNGKVTNGVVKLNAEALFNCPICGAEVGIACKDNCLFTQIDKPRS